MLDFFAELKRRHVYRVGAAYAVIAAWGFPDYWRERGWPDLCRPSAPTISSATEK